MCGVAGIFTTNHYSTEAYRRLIAAMTDSLIHRGPDAGGLWVENNVAFGHRRLSIIDRSPAGEQPMYSACGRYLIVFNGEIYNHLDLRQELREAGVQQAWRGYSDTETLLAGIAHWGLDETLLRAAGMFAIALWDRRDNCLSLARDRIGEKPLYWGWAGNSVVFGSELKALRQHPDFSNEVCRKALAQYLRFAYVPAPLSIYSGIFKLEPGCILSIDGEPPTAPPEVAIRPGDTYQSLSIRRYWSSDEMIEAGVRTEFTSESEASIALDVTLRSAVSRQMVADVPLGAFLSGGIDSSLVVALMQAQSSKRVQTFTVGFENPAFDEARSAATVAGYLGTDHTELKVTEQEAQEVIPLLPNMYDEPFADSSQIPTHLVCRAARRSVVVALSGDGGDELFGGYNRYLWGPRIWQQLALVPVSLRRPLAASLAAIPTSVLEYSVGSRVSRPGEKLQKLAERLGDVASIDDLYRNLVSEWSGADLVIGLESEGNTLLDDPLPEILVDDASSRMMAQDVRTYLPDDILCKVDRAAMAVGLETRVPFLDPDVLAVAARLPKNMKIRDGKGKWALRQLLCRYVPRDLIERPKTGFSIPLGEWLRGPLRDWAEEFLSEENILRDGLIRPGPVRQAWEEHLSGRRDWTQRIWIILMLMAWRRSVA